MRIPSDCKGLPDYHLTSGEDVLVGDANYLRIMSGASCTSNPDYLMMSSGSPKYTTIEVFCAVSPRNYLWEVNIF